MKKGVITKESITDLLSKNKIKDVFDSLQKLDLENLLSDKLTGLSARFIKYEHDKALDLVSVGDYNVEIGKIIRAIQLIIGEIDFKRFEKKKEVDDNVVMNRIHDIDIDDEDMAKALDIYIDRGEFIWAKSVLLSKHGGSFKELPLTSMLKLIEIEQKYGLLKEAREHINYILNHSNQIEDEIKLFKTKVLDFRIMSQERDCNKLISTYEALLDKAMELNELPFKCTILNRVGVAFAAIHDYQKSKQCFEESKEHAISLRQDHSYITANCLHAMCALLKKVPYEEGDALSVLINSQIEYLQKKTVRHIWQGNVFKSSVQCLFAEASYYLWKGEKSKGNYRLCIANQFVTLAKANSQTEGYSELITIIGDRPSIKNEVELAMNGYQNKNSFQTKVKMQIGELLIASAPAFAAINNAPDFSSWDAVREAINKYDKKQ